MKHTEWNPPWWHRTSLTKAAALSVDTWWTTPGRHYHTLQHLDEMLVHLARAHREVEFEHPAEVFVAALLHDAVYVVGRPDNEARSAELVDEWLQLHAPQLDPRRVEALILATADHTAPPTADQDTRLFLDADLAILGASPPRFAEYERQVEAEWLPVVGLEAYESGRRSFLLKCLAGPLFQSAWGQKTWSETAQINLEAAARV